MPRDLRTSWSEAQYRKYHDFKEEQRQQKESLLWTGNEVDKGKPPPKLQFKQRLWVTGPAAENAIVRLSLVLLCFDTVSRMFSVCFVLALIRKGHLPMLSRRLCLLNWSKSLRAQVATLKTMGFTHDQAEAAAKATKGGSVEDAAAFLLGGAASGRRVRR